ncbi:MAG: cephalosporin-C deacetylase [Gaiellaceae bacterium]|nr:cephalosporin-C deacetylase [Gaiellaceae bacterium]
MALPPACGDDRTSILFSSVPTFDLPLDQLQAYAPELAEPADLDAFWADTLAETRAHDLDVRLEPVETGLVAVRTWDVTYSGFGGHRVRGWLHLPAQATGPLAAVVQYQGYGGGRGLAHESILWAAAGYAHFVMDTRGQGSGWSTGDTPDPVGAAPAHPGSMTRGILDPADYYYRRVFADAVRAVEAVRGHEAVDATRVAVAGGSQGGGISLAVAGLLPDIAATLPDVPFLCAFPRAIAISPNDPYTEIVRYLKVHRDHEEQVLATLSYFDCATLARRASAPALFSVALMDETCPPSTVYAAYNAYAGPKAISVYAYNDHEGGGPFHQVAQLRWLRETLE